MRPRPDAAEKLIGEAGPEAVVPLASMRPRPDAAEKAKWRTPVDLGNLASMRPRPDAAEKPGGEPPEDVMAARFNEAAARCRGKGTTGMLRIPLLWWYRFNEAAARCRGKVYHTLSHTTLYHLLQ